MKKSTQSATALFVALLVKMASPFWLTTAIILLVARVEAFQVQVPITITTPRQVSKRTSSFLKSATTDVPVPLQETAREQDTQKEDDSKVLTSILGGLTTQEFLETIWQSKPCVFSTSSLPSGTTSATPSTPTSSTDTTSKWNSSAMEKSPLEEIIRQGWNVLVDALQNAPLVETPHREPPMVLVQGHIQPLTDILKYYHSLWGAYLDGASIVQIHADLVSPWIAALCLDLQNVFPYVYAQTYLTPPGSQTLDPHADDRDVFVIQLVGQKHWKVYQQVPIELPYPHEQVGKRPDLPVPPSVLKGPTSVEQILRPGNVLYIPRGHVHEASCDKHSFSYHITIAVATFDWTLAGILHSVTKEVWMRNTNCRKSILPLASSKQLQHDLTAALQLLQDEITTDMIVDDLNARIQRHVQKDDPLRTQLIQQYQTPTNQPPDGVVTGPHAVPYVTLDSRVRTTTAEEFNQHDNQPHVYLRKETREDLWAVWDALQADPSRSCRVSDLKSLLLVESDESDEDDKQPHPTNSYLCDLTLLSFVKHSVARGELALVTIVED